MSDGTERFDLLLQEKIDELEQAEHDEAALASDEVEHLRLRAAHLVTGAKGRPWATGATVQFQQDPATHPKASPTLDIRFPARPSRRPPDAAIEAPVGRQGGRAP
jgi:hypothetical protein